MKKYLIIILIAFPLTLEASTVVNVLAGTETINAIEGTLVLPRDIVVQRITTGDSAVLIWIKTPTWDPKDRTISFAGFSPGGFSGTQPLFTLELSSDFATHTGGKLFGYRNNGEGTQVVLKYTFSTDTPEEDLIPPELFKPIISSSPDIFDGVRFISFTTQDKGTGVERYEYADKWLFSPNKEDWREAMSPVPLSQSMLFKKIYIRAIDRSGNTAVVSTASLYRYATLLFGTIIVICILLFLKRSFRLRSPLSF